MTDDAASAAWRAELNEQLARLEPAIHGLTDLSVIPISQELQAKICEQIEHYKRRLHLIKRALDSIDDLFEDGYPDLFPVSVVDALFTELQEKQAEIASAIAIFQSEATGLRIVFGEPRPKE